MPYLWQMYFVDCHGKYTLFYALIYCVIRAWIEPFERRGKFWISWRNKDFFGILRGRSICSVDSISFSPPRYSSHQFLAVLLTDNAMMKGSVLRILGMACCQYGIFIKSLGQKVDFQIRYNPAPHYCQTELTLYATARICWQFACGWLLYVPVTNLFVIFFNYFIDELEFNTCLIIIRQ